MKYVDKERLKKKVSKYYMCGITNRLLRRVKLSILYTHLCRWVNVFKESSEFTEDTLICRQFILFYLVNQNNS